MQIQKLVRKERIEFIARILLNSTEPISRKDIEYALKWSFQRSIPKRSLQRLLREFRDKGFVTTHSQGRGTKYSVAPYPMRKINEIREEFEEERFHWARYSPKHNDYPHLMPAEVELLQQYVMNVGPTPPVGPEESIISVIRLLGRLLLQRCRRGRQN